jgi:hypothetical protein
MKPIKLILLLFGLLLCTTAAGTSIVALAQSNDFPSLDLSTLLDIAKPAEQVRLFPAAQNRDFAMAEDYTIAGSEGLVSQQTADDGSTTYVTYRPDHTMKESLSWYRGAGNGHGRLESETLYTADGVHASEQDKYRPDGSRQSKAQLLPDGDYQTIAYRQDGATPEDETLVGHGPDPYDDRPELLSEARWLDNGKLGYTNTLNADSSRTVEQFDEGGNILSLTHLTAYINGSTAIGYYPGTKTVRFQSSSTYFETTYNAYRPDGTLAMADEISGSAMQVDYYDPSGKFVTFEQEWSFTPVEVNGVTGMQNFVLYSLTVMDAQGQPKQEWFTNWGSRYVTEYDVYNVPLNTQPPRICKDLINFYNSTNGSLSDTSCPNASPPLPSGITDQPDAAISQPPPVPAAYSQPPVFVTAVPIPFEERGGR